MDDDVIARCLCPHNERQISERGYPPERWRSVGIVQSIDGDLVPAEGIKVCRGLSLQRQIPEVAEQKFEGGPDGDTLTALLDAELLAVVDYRAYSHGDPILVDGTKTTAQSFAGDILQFFNLASWLSNSGEAGVGSMYHFCWNDPPFFTLMREVGRCDGFVKGKRK